MNVRTIALSLLAAAVASPLANAADTVIAKFVPSIGNSLQYGSFGYVNQNDEYIVLTGNQIVSTRIVVDFIPAPAVDPATFLAAMVVPTDGPSQFLTVEGSQLTAVGDGSYHYEATTTDFNGTIYAGRFSVDSYGVDPLTGDPISLGDSTFGPETGFYFTVALPEPATLSVLAGGTLVCSRRRR